MHAKIVNETLPMKRLENIRTELVADAFLKLDIEDRTIPGIQPLEPDMRVCGPVFTAEYADLSDTRKSLYEFNRFMVDIVPKNTILVIENSGDISKAGVWGELVSISAQARGVSGVITNGRVRDTDAIKTLGFPVFATGKAVHNSNKAYKVVATQSEISLNGVTIRADDIILADSSGVVVISLKDIEKVVAFAEKKMQDEIKIARLARTGMSLEDIHQIMTQQKNEPVTFEMTGLAKLGIFAAVTSVLVAGACYLSSSEHADSSSIP